MRFLNGGLVARQHLKSPRLSAPLQTNRTELVRMYRAAGEHGCRSGKATAAWRGKLLFSNLIELWGRSAFAVISSKSRPSVLMLGN
jgi:hypothetical protein